MIVDKKTKQAEYQRALELKKFQCFNDKVESWRPFCI